MNQTLSLQEPVAVVVVDHGSRRAASNEMLLDVVELFRQNSPWAIVEAAHMELASPSIADAFARCVEQGAKTVVVSPWFLSPGRHWAQDIPRLTAEAASSHVGVEFLVSAPLGLHSLMTQVLQERIQHCLQHAAGEVEACEVCKDRGGCRMGMAAPLVSS